MLTGDTVLGRGTTVVAHPDGQLGDYLDSLHRLTRLAEAGTARRCPATVRCSATRCGALDGYLAHRGERLAQVREARAAWTRGRATTTPSRS